MLERIEMRARGEKIEIGYQTGIPYIDRNFKGLKKGWMVYCAGSPNVGKTKMATQVSAVLAAQAPGCYIAMEGDEESTAFRLLEGKLGLIPLILSSEKWMQQHLLMHLATLKS